MTTKTEPCRECGGPAHENGFKGVYRCRSCGYEWDEANPLCGINCGTPMMQRNPEDH